MTTAAKGIWKSPQNANPINLQKLNLVIDKRQWKLVALIMQQKFKIDYKQVQG